MRNKKRIQLRLKLYPSFSIDLILLQSMVKWLHNLLFVAISFSFFISATEMDLGEVHNTFFDQYDTYVKTEQVSIDHSIAVQQEHDTYTLIYSVLSYYFALGEKPKKAIKPPENYCNHYPPKLYLRNSVWRI